MLRALSEERNSDQTGLRNAPWTLDEVRQRLRSAAYTLRRLPMPRHGRPQGFKAGWPDVVHDWMAFGWVPMRAPRLPASAAEIDRMDEAIGWLHWLSRDQRLVLWARSQSPPWAWRKLEALDEMERDGRGRTERALRSIMRDGEERILSKLNGMPGRARLEIGPGGVLRPVGRGQREARP